MQVVQSQGAVALTLNDSGGNANITFNDAGAGDQDGSSARISSDVDGTTGVLQFEVAAGAVAGTPIPKNRS